MYNKNKVIDMSTFEWLLGNELKCHKWTKIENSSNKLYYYNERLRTFDENLSLTIKYFYECVENEQCIDENIHLVFKSFRMHQ